MRLKRQRGGGWPKAEIETHQTTMRAAYIGSSSAAYFVQIPGTFHSNFMDVPLWSPLTPMLGIAGPIDGPTRQFPKVIFESRSKP